MTRTIRLMADLSVVDGFVSAFYKRMRLETVVNYAEEKVYLYVCRGKDGDIASINLNLMDLKEGEFSFSQSCPESHFVIESFWVAK
jgi:hypothetical protein